MIKKCQLNSLLIQIQGTVQSPSGVKEIGLLTEDSGLGLKRKLRKIQKELFEHLEQFKKDADEVNKIEDEGKRTAEAERLMNETVELKAEKAMMSEIEKINSSFAYDFDLIDLIAE